MNFQQARTNMVIQQIRPWYVNDEQVLSILSQISREIFVPPAYLNLAYSDTDIPLSENQTMLAPKIVGRALQTLNLSGTEKVLEVGTGTGYITACLSKLAAQLFSIEIQSSLLAMAEKTLSTLNCRNLTLEQGDGVLGWTKYAPYDAIIVTGSYPLGVPQILLDQLNPNKGRLFAFSGLSPSMQAVLIERKDKSQFQTRFLFETVVPPMIHAPQPHQFRF